MKKIFSYLSIITSLLIVTGTLFKINHWQNADVMAQIGWFAIPALIAGLSGYIICLGIEKRAPAKQHRN